MEIKRKLATIRRIEEVRDIEGKEEKDSCLQKVELCGSDTSGWFPCIVAYAHEDEIGF